MSDTGTRSSDRLGRGELGPLLAVVVRAQVAFGPRVVGRVERPPRRRRIGSGRCGAACASGTTASGRPGPRPASSRGRPRRPVGCSRRRRSGSSSCVAARHDLEAAVVDRGVVDRDHARHVDVDEAVRRRVLVRRVAGAAGRLVVDLLLVEHRGLAEQRRRGVEQRPVVSSARRPSWNGTKFSLRHSFGPSSVSSRWCSHAPPSSGQAATSSTQARSSATSPASSVSTSSHP